MVPCQKNKNPNTVNTDITKYSQGTDDRNLSIMVTDPNVGKLHLDKLLQVVPHHEQPALPSRDI